MVRMILTAGDNVQTGRKNTLHLGYDACALARQSLRGSDMAQNDTLILRVALYGQKSIYRDIEGEQYPDPDDFDEDAPRYGINPVTGEIIIFGKRGTD
jgi:hypothetical protein